MKKTVALVLALIMCLSLFSCGNEKAEKYCWSCGEGISKDASFCEHCGAAVKDSQTDTIAFPPKNDQKDSTATPESYFTYSIEYEQATVTAFSDTYQGEVIIPETLGGYPVTNIDYEAFRDCTSITSVVIPDGVTIIGAGAFMDCHNLASVTIGNSVTSIGSWAFSGCDSLTCMTIPDSVTSIGSWAFKNCYNLASVTIGNSVTNIGGWAFENCDSLTSVTIPASVTTIGVGAFICCANLNTVYFKTSAQSIVFSSDFTSNVKRVVQ